MKTLASEDARQWHTNRILGDDDVLAPVVTRQRIERLFYILVDGSAIETFNGDPSEFFQIAFAERPDDHVYQ